MMMTKILAYLPLMALTAAIISGPAISAPAPPPSPARVQFGADSQLSVATSGIHDFVEPAIASNPLDPANLVAAFFGLAQGFSPCFLRYSKDGGATWASGGTAATRSPDDFCADPSLAADPAGAFYFAYLDFVQVGFTFISDVRVARSTDGGASFPESSVVVVGGGGLEGPAPDKPWIAVDLQPKSHFRGTIYLTYTDFANDGSQNMVVISRDAGRSWSAPVAIGPFVPVGPTFFAETVQATLPVVAPDGTVFVFYLHADELAMRSAIRFVTSRDGGRTWSPAADVAADLPTPGIAFRLDDGEPKFGTDPGAGFDGWSAPTAAVAPDGTLYVAWTDFPEGSCSNGGGTFSPATCTNADVRLALSKDDGRSWSAPVKVSDDATATDQFFPWIATHPNGLMSLVWLDKRLDPTNVNFDLFYTNTGDGQRFLPNVRVTSQSSLGSHAIFIGDYNGLVVSGGAIVPVWNDLRDPNGVQIFTARGTLVP